MPRAELERLADAGVLKREPFLREEYDGLLRNAAVALEDAGNTDLHPESRFDLAYSAAHALAVAALRRLGYRSANRQVVFQALAHTLGTQAASWRVLAKCHEQRNRREYEGLTHVDTRLLAELLRAVAELQTALSQAPPRE